MTLDKPPKGLIESLDAGQVPTAEQVIAFINDILKKEGSTAEIGAFFEALKKGGFEISSIEIKKAVPEQKNGAPDQNFEKMSDSQLVDVFDRLFPNYERSVYPVPTILEQVAVIQELRARNIQPVLQYGKSINHYISGLHYFVRSTVEGPRGTPTGEIACIHKQSWVKNPNDRKNFSIIKRGEVDIYG